ncbi:MAG: hypothetical protein R2991_03215 [Thermoanaerobaculia bacterium]
MSRHLSKALIVVLLGATAGAAAAQGAEQPAERSAQTTLSGCLAGVDGQWMITGEEGAHAVVEGAVDLEPHNGHEVRLTGEWIRNAEGQEAFRAQAVEDLGQCRRG